MQNKISNSNICFVDRFEDDENNSWGDATTSYQNEDQYNKFNTEKILNADFSVGSRKLKFILVSFNNSI